MQRCQWTNANSVFLPEVDAEHRNLFHMVDELHAAILAKASAVQVMETLRALIAAIEDHLSYEERRMRATRYPFYAWHKRQHDTVRKRVKLYAPRVENGDPEAALPLLEFLASWLHDHTALTDRMMGAYLRNHERQSVRASARGASA